jgi:uncharacterized membrane protein (UPF0127 family)
MGQQERKHMSDYSSQVKIIEDENGNQCIEFTPEQMKALNLKCGDTVEWNIEDEENGVVSFRVVK